MVRPVFVDTTAAVDGARKKGRDRPGPSSASHITMEGESPPRAAASSTFKISCVRCIPRYRYAGGKSSRNEERARGRSGARQLHRLVERPRTTSDRVAFCSALPATLESQYGRTVGVVGGCDRAVGRFRDARTIGEISPWRGMRLTRRVEKRVGIRFGAGSERRRV